MNSNENMSGLFGMNLLRIWMFQKYLSGVADLYSFSLNEFHWQNHEIRRDNLCYKCNIVITFYIAVEPLSDVAQFKPSAFPVTKDNEGNPLISYCPNDPVVSTKSKQRCAGNCQGISRKKVLNKLWMWSVSIDWFAFKGQIKTFFFFVSLAHIMLCGSTFIIRN